jgi:NADPH-dependent F420 reductase
MKVGIIGSGNVGSSLGAVWAAKGHEIIFGVRDSQSDKVKELLASIGSNASAKDIKDAVAASDVVVLTTPWQAAKEVIENAGDLTGKILIDCTNPLDANLSGLTIGLTSSAAEEVSHWARGAKVVKAFNTTGSGNMLDSNYGSQAPDMFICGDDEEAKNVVSKLVVDAGFDVIDSGPLSNARLLEPMAMLWIYLAIKQGLGPDIAFKLIRR